MEEEEDPMLAAKREIKEELKIDINKDNLVHLAKFVTKAETSEGEMSMTTNVFSMIIDKEIKLTASDDLTGLVELTLNQFRDLISNMYSLTGTLVTEKFSFDWQDWGKIYGPIHELSMNEFLIKRV